MELQTTIILSREAPFNIKLVKLIISQEILNFNFLCGNLLNEILIMFNN